MANESRLEIARSIYQAFADADRGVVERVFSDDFTFSSPLDVGLDRAGYFERCWPGAGQRMDFEFVRLIESGDEVVVTYQSRRPDGSRGRNTEVLTFRGDQICGAEVYFGWDLSVVQRRDGPLSRLSRLRAARRSSPSRSRHRGGRRAFPPPCGSSRRRS